MTAMPKSGGSNCRYEIRYTASETGKEHVFGWTDQAVTAEKMRSCLMVEPYALTARVIDRGVPDSLRLAGIPLAADTQQLVGNTARLRPCTEHDFYISGWRWEGDRYTRRFICSHCFHAEFRETRQPKSASQIEGNK